MQQQPIYSHNPHQAEGFPLLVLHVARQVCSPANEGFLTLHWHREIQFVYVIQGIVHVKIYDEELDVPAGSALFINREVLHYITEKVDCCYHSYIVPEEMLGFFPGSLMERQDVTPIVHNPLFTHCLLSAENEGCQLVLKKLAQLDALYFESQPQPYREYRIAVALAALWLEFITRCTVPQKAASPREYQRIRTLISFIHTNYNKQITVDHIAMAAHVSKTECLRCFQRFVGTSPYSYLIKYRLHISAGLLRDNSQTITEIAMNVGFQSASSYISYFKKEYGITPSRYREKAQGEQ